MFLLICAYLSEIFNELYLSDDFKTHTLCLFALIHFHIFHFLLTLKDFNGLMAETKKYQNLGNKLFGIQYDELPEELKSSPSAFASWTRARREAALSIASSLRNESTGNKGQSVLSGSQVVELLQEHGMSVQVLKF